MELIQPLNATNVKKFVGGKSKNMHYLKTNGIKTPQSWIIDTKYPLSLLRDKNIAVEKGVRFQDITRAYKYFDGELEKKIYQEIWNQVDNFLADQSRSIRTGFAIRSSHVLEDGDTTSFAGLYRTELNVRHTGEMVNSIVKCWRDSFKNGISEYTNNDLTLQFPCSILIQEMIPSRAGGVLFADKEKIIVNGNLGLAKSVVDGISLVDEWSVNKETNEIYFNASRKEIALVPAYEKTNPKKGERVCCADLLGKPFFKANSFSNKEKIIEVVIDEDYKNSPCLTTNELRLLCDISEISAKVLNYENYDLEWALNHQGDFVILQIRPLTRLIENIDRNYITNERVGLGIVKGIAKGKAFFVETEKQAKLFPEGGILAARRLEGSILYAAQKASGCLLESRSPLAHSAIIARELGIPAIGAIDLTTIEDNKYYLINGDTGEFSLCDEDTIVENQIFQSENTFEKILNQTNEVSSISVELLENMYGIVPDCLKEIYRKEINT